ncbi:MAG: hypothetical protein HDQ99_21335 [Lachnospiraceae bacterium]|nr:hypothetical protein [Lachnospiraceae bacterium]MBD5538136.1 hypothetical protein [Lachnospiraceae bacterium]
MTGKNLWDEILKAVFFTRPQQLFHLFKEIYGKEYPPDTSIHFISTEYSTFLDSPNTKVPTSQLMDFAVLVGGTDYYHIECQMKNDKGMVIRMVAYDFHFAIQHCTSTEPATGEIIMHFPDSVVIYPEKNGKLPDTLRCRIIFSDKSEHIYQIPTVKIQSYSLDDIHQKHLNFFLPYTLLRFRPLLKYKKQIDAKELTSFVEKIIVDLEEEVRNGILSQRESEDLILLLTKASAHIFAKHPHYHEEVFHLTEPLIKLPSVRINELEQESKQKDAIIAQKDSEIAQKDLEINHLQKLLTSNGILC